VGGIFQRATEGAKAIGGTVPSGNQVTHGEPVKDEPPGENPVLERDLSSLDVLEVGNRRPLRQVLVQRIDRECAGRL
jgi:hypothetical protein